MGDGRSKHGEDLRGASELALTATLAITELVEELHSHDREWARGARSAARAAGDRAS